MCHSTCEPQGHVHELIGSVGFENECGHNCHNHRFTTITGEAVRTFRNHYHEVSFTTDTADGHYHDFCGKTGEAIDVGYGKHVHFIKEITDREDGHKHSFQASTLIENPTLFEKKFGKEVTKCQAQETNLNSKNA